jgi:hypothetical protein
VRLSWNDVALNDVSVTGYMVYRRKKGDRYFTPLSKTALPGAWFNDSSTLAPGIYEYGCSSIDAWGHVSILSPLAEVSLTTGSGIDAIPLYPPAGFSLRNTEAGIEISLPATAGPAATGPAPTNLATTKPAATGQHYILYRRDITEKQYRKISEITTTTYTDREVRKDQLYAYTITLQRDNTESSKSGEKSIRRK